jgi:GT2 family glycosyltransferase
MSGLLRAVRGFLHRHAGVKRLAARAVGPFFPVLAPLAAHWQAPRYDAWFTQWQASGARDDAAIRAAVGEDPPPFLIRGDIDTASLHAQVAARWETGTDDDALRRCAEAGGFVLHLRHDHRLSRHALACFAIAARGTGALVLYADEDVLDGARHRDPWFKTGFDPDRLLQQNSLGHAVAYAARFLLNHGLQHLRGHALALAATAAAGDAIHHIPAVLLHRAPADAAPWRAVNREAIAATLPAGATLTAAPDGTPRILWPLPHPAPLVSVIVPTRDGAALLRRCVHGLLHDTDYPAIEIIVMDNGSTEPATHALFESWSTDSRLRILHDDAPFDFAALNNRAAEAARGDVLVLLNNDTELTHPGWLDELVRQALRPEIGPVGALLRFPGGRVQHAGIVLGVGRVAGHDMLFAAPGDPGLQDALRVVRRVSAVTAACLAIRRETWSNLGGMDGARFRVAYNDVDLCLRAGATALACLVTPHATLLHHESASRGSDLAPARLAEWQREAAALRDAWGAVLDADPFSSPLLSRQTPYRTLAARPAASLPWRKGDGAVRPSA